LSPNPLNSNTFPDSLEAPIFILETETYRNVMAKLYDDIDISIDNRKWKLPEFYSIYIGGVHGVSTLRMLQTKLQHM